MRKLLCDFSQTVYVQAGDECYKFFLSYIVQQYKLINKHIFKTELLQSRFIMVRDIFLLNDT